MRQPSARSPAGGSTQRRSRRAGHPIDWARLDEADNETASVPCFRGDPAPLRRLLDRHVTRPAPSARPDPYPSSASC